MCFPGKPVEAFGDSGDISLSLFFLSLSLARSLYLSIYLSIYLLHSLSHALRVSLSVSLKRNSLRSRSSAGSVTVARRSEREACYWKVASVNEVGG